MDGAQAGAAAAVAAGGGQHESRPKTIAVHNFKGGAAKTTHAANLGAALANLGKKVLLVDYDSQANLSTLFQPSMEEQNAIGQQEFDKAVRLMSSYRNQRDEAGSLAARGGPGSDREPVVETYEADAFADPQTMATFHGTVETMMADADSRPSVENAKNINDIFSPMFTEI